jgi:hypothetical protein
MKLAILMLCGAMFAGAACSTDTDSEEDLTEESVAYKLAALHGDLGTEAEFQRIIDCIMASGIEGAETEEKEGDTLYASWEQSSQQDSLLEWARAFC